MKINTKNITNLTNLKNYKALISGGALALLLLAMPLVGFAKEKNHDSEKDKKEKDNKIENQIKIKKNDREDDRGCFRAFGHLIAPGWIKHNGSITIYEDCRLPFGIGKKFRGNNASTTPPTPSNDTTAPIISTVNFRPAKTQAEVLWMTDEKSDSTVYWGISSPVDTSSSTGKVIVRNRLIRDHQIVLKNLTASTTYYVVVRSRDASGNTATSSTFSFVTKAQSPDTELPVISSVVTVSATSSIKVGWMTNELTTGRVYYSTALPVSLNATTTTFVDSASSTKNHLITLPSLTPGTQYYIVIEATDTAGNVSTSATFSAVTGNHTPTVPADTTAPVISAVSTVNGVSTSTLSWTTNEPATSKVYYGTSSSAVNTSTAAFVVNTSLVTSHSLPLTGLTASTTYYVVLESEDVAGNTATSSQLSLTTGI